MAASKITPQKVSRFNEILHRYKLIHLYIYSNQVKSICFQPVHWLSVVCLEDMSPFAASNFDSPRAAQTEAARNSSEWHMNDIWMTFLHEFLQRSVATWKHVNDWCSLPIFLQVKKFVLVSQMPFLQGADGPALRIKGRAGNQSGDLGTVALFDWTRNGGNFHISHSGRVAAPATLAATVAEWLSGWVPEWLRQSLWQSGWVAAPATLAEWLSGWVPAWQSGWVAEWLHQPLWQSGCVAEWLRQSHQSMKWIKFLNVSISKQDLMTLTATWFTKITL